MSGISAEPSIKFKFHVSEVFDAGDWEGLPKPAIFEAHPWMAQAEENDDPRFRMLERARRSLIFQFLSSESVEHGFHRTYEGTGSTDTFNVVLKTLQFEEAKKIYKRIRKIAIELPSDDFYSRIEVTNVIDRPERGFWYSTFQAICYRVGRVVADG